HSPSVQVSLPPHVCVGRGVPVIAFALALLLSLELCKDCTLSGASARLCPKHSAEETAACSREEKRLRSSEEAERIAAIEALAALTNSHENAPSERVVNRIATALGDKSYKVRERATSLLGRPQHALASLAALEKALGESEKELAHSAKEQEEN